jgi:hypothetical protein
MNVIFYLNSVQNIDMILDFTSEQWLLNHRGYIYYATHTWTKRTCRQITRAAPANRNIMAYLFLSLWTPQVRSKRVYICWNWKCLCPSGCFTLKTMSKARQSYHYEHDNKFISVITYLLTCMSTEKPFGKVSATYFHYSYMKYFKTIFFCFMNKLRINLSMIMCLKYK